MNPTTQTEERQCSRHNISQLSHPKVMVHFTKPVMDVEKKIGFTTKLTVRPKKVNQHRGLIIDQSDEGQSSQRAYGASEKGKATRKAYCESEQGKSARKAARKFKAYRESEKGKAAITEQLECECGSSVQRKPWAHHLKSKPHHRWLNARESLASVLVELLDSHK